MTKEISKLEKASKILDEIKKLDSSIIHLERVADILVNHETETDFTLSVKNLNPIAKEDSKQNVLDEEGNLIIDHNSSISELTIRSLFFGHIHKGKEKDDNKENIAETIPTDVSLAMLGVLLQYYKSKRERLINKIQKLGFNI